jgi:hypothetical protein
MISYQAIFADLSVVNKRGQSFMHNRYSGPQIFSKLAETYAHQSEETKLRIRQAFNHVDVFGRTVLHYVCEHGLTFAKQMIETFELDINPNARTLNLQIGYVVRCETKFVCCIRIGFP